jgi:DNA-binding NtrC family response regulator
MNDETVLYIDDESENLVGFEACFASDFSIATTDNIIDAFEILKNENIKVVLIDYKKPKEDGISFVLRIMEKYPNLVFILVTAYSDLNTATEIMKLNIFYELVLKPWNYDQLKFLIDTAIEKYNLEMLDG